jgi:hypothetical protein
MRPARRLIERSQATYRDASRVTSKQRIRLYPQLTAVAVTESGFDDMPTVAPPAGRGWEYLTGTSGGWVEEWPYHCPARAGAALRDWMASTMAQAETSGSELDGRFWERRDLRAHIMNTEPELRGRASYYPFERVLAEAIGEDLVQSANSLIPRLAALSAVAGLRELYESDEAQALAAPPNAAELLKLVGTVIRFTQAGTGGAR